MRLRLNLDDIIVQLEIRGYRDWSPGEAIDWKHDWCETDYSFVSEPWLNYRVEHDDGVILSDEVRVLYSALDQLLCGKLKKRTEIEFAEPDFFFVLQPKWNLWSRPGTIYVRPGCETVDISAEWRIYIGASGPISNYLSVAIYRNDIINLKNYLGLVSGKLSETDPEIARMIETETLIM